MGWKPAGKVVGRWLAAVLIATLLGSIVQTQFNLQALVDLGLAIPLHLRLQTTWLDLLRFTPAYAAIVAISFALAFPVAAWMVRRWPRQRWLIALSGASAIMTALVVMHLLLKLTAIAAARSLWGVLALALAGALGAWVFGRLGKRYKVPDA